MFVVATDYYYYYYYGQSVPIKSREMYTPIPILLLSTTVTPILIRIRFFSSVSYSIYGTHGTGQIVLFLFPPFYRTYGHFQCRQCRTSTVIRIIYTLRKIGGISNLLNENHKTYQQDQGHFGISSLFFSRFVCYAAFFGGMMGSHADVTSIAATTVIAATTAIATVTTTNWKQQEQGRSPSSSSLPTLYPYLLLRVLS